MMLNIGYVWNETNTDVRMYTWRIYSSRSARIAVHGWSELLDEIYIGIYTSATMDEKGWESLWSQLTHIISIELQLHENVSSGDYKLWNVISAWASNLAPVGIKRGFRTKQTLVEYEIFKLNLFHAPIHFLDLDHF